ncbi:hypothetical protein MMYC01_200848 [Madurella mycetomatis]|uniref:Rhodopsin domain-containing protein n=1 Tax=Madurella mycetomatis TaxID=100816 RepID=A0A175WII0_9PEZI|nr:hypothetical protein MMYC01_200848 [Madurella mycetomatis]
MDPTAGSAPQSFGPPDPSLIPSPPTDAAKQVAHAFAGISVTLNVISFLVFGGRIWTRSVPVFRLAWDDYAISVAYVLVLANSILLLLTVPYAFGSDPNSMTLQDVINGNKYAVISQPMWAWSMAAIKISVAGMLMRVEQEKPWRRFLWAMVAVQVVLCIYNTIIQAVQCIPLEAAWDLLGLITDAECISKDAIRISSICVSSVNVATDIIFALLPINFLRKVQRPLRERIIIGILMGLGIFASVASMIKAAAAANFGRTDDPNAEGISIGTWSCIEEQIGFIAACIPCLRSPFQKLLARWGIVTTQNGGTKPTAASGYGGMYGGGSARRGTRDHTTANGDVVRLESMRDATSNSEENILAEIGDIKSQVIWRTTEVRLEEHDRAMDSPNYIQKREDYHVV